MSDENYRSELAARLGVKGSPDALRSTADYGLGSSFEGRSNMPDGKLLSRRFEVFEEDPFFRELCNDSEVIELNEQLLGETESSRWGRNLS